MRTDIIC